MRLYNCAPEELLLYAITDRSWLNGRTVYEQCEEALKGGATMIQLREKELDDKSFFEEAVEIKKLCEKYNVPLLINDNVKIAVEMDADGVHVGQRDMQAGDVRELIGPNRILGVSAQTVEQALRAEKCGADYLGVGAVFKTGTKSDATEVDFETLKAICEAVTIPVVAIGGITKENMIELKDSGIVGIAVISAVFAADDITEATKELCKKMKAMVK